MTPLSHEMHRHHGIVGVNQNQHPASDREYPSQSEEKTPEFRDANIIFPLVGLTLTQQVCDL